MKKIIIEVRDDAPMGKALEGTIKLTSDNTGVATVTNGIVNAKKGGNAVITAATSETSISFTIVVKDVVIKNLLKIRDKLKIPDIN